MKYKNEVCRFKSGKFLNKETLVAEPMPENMPEKVKLLVLHKRKEILQKVNDYKNNFLNPSKVNFFNPLREDFTKVKSVYKVLKEIDINVEENENALKISDDNNFQLHLRRSTDPCFVNNYFDIGLLAWEANIDIQPVFDNCKASTYICSYLSKQEDKCSEVMHQAFKAH